MNRYLSLIVITFLASLSFSFSDTNGIWTYAEDIRPGIFGGDEGASNFTFNSVVHFNDDLVYKSTRLEDLFVNRSGDSMQGDLSITSRYIRMDEDDDNDWGFISEAGQDGIGLLGNVARYPTLDLYVEHDGEVKVNNNILNLTENNIENVNVLRGNRVELDGTSYIKNVVSEKYFSSDSTDYYLDPSDYSLINNLNVEGSISGPTITNINSDITNIENQISNQEDDISSIDRRVTVNEDDITNIETDISNQGDEISSIDRRVTVNEDDITNIEAEISNQGDEISSIDRRVIDIETNEEPPVCTGKNLLQWDGNNWQCVSMYSDCDGRDHGESWISRGSCRYGGDPSRTKLTCWDGDVRSEVITEGSCLRSPSGR